MLVYWIVHVHHHQRDLQMIYECSSPAEFVHFNSVALGFISFGQTRELKANLNVSLMMRANELAGRSETGLLLASGSSDE